MLRRDFVRTSLLGSSVLAAPGLLSGIEADGLRVGVTDWTIGGQAQLKAFDLAAEIGLQGIQVSIFPEAEGGQFDLRQPEARKALREKAAESGVEIASTAMGIFNKRPFKSFPDAVKWATEGIGATAALEQSVMLLAFFGKNDLKGDAEGTAETIKRLKAIAPVAEDKGVALGLETTLSGDEHLHILDSVDSAAVQVYYDLGNSQGNGYDINAEIRKLGRERICEVHCKEREGGIFGAGEVDFPAAGKALREIGYDSWLILEGGNGKGMTMLETLKNNAGYLRESGFSKS